MDEFLKWAISQGPFAVLSVYLLIRFEGVLKSVRSALERNTRVMIAICTKIDMPIQELLDDPCEEDEKLKIKSRGGAGGE